MKKKLLLSFILALGVMFMDIPLLMLGIYPEPTSHPLAIPVITPIVLTRGERAVSVYTRDINGLAFNDLINAQVSCLDEEGYPEKFFINRACVAYISNSNRLIVLAAPIETIPRELYMSIGRTCEFVKVNQLDWRYRK